MNKGLQIRNKKLQKKRELRKTIKPYQENICRFIKVKNPKTEKINGKFKFVGFVFLYGLQIENKMYYIKEGKVGYIYLNKKNLKILKKFKEIPSDTPQPLIDMFNKYRNVDEN